jgi:NhaP-type Na+/H+ or K+/H+ antiporter
MLRRFAFVVIAMLLFERPWLQAILYWQISFLALVFILAGMPFIDLISNKIEVMNEVFVLLIGYHLCILTGFSMEASHRKAFGVSIIVLVLMLICVHYIRWFIGVYWSLKLRYVRR